MTLDHSTQSGTDGVRPDAALLARYLMGDTSPEERASVARWIAAVPGRRVQIEQLGRALAQASVPRPVNVDAFSARLSAAITAEDASTVSAYRNKKSAPVSRPTGRTERVGPRAVWRTRLAYGVGIALAAVVGAAGVYAWREAATAHAVVATASYATAAAQRAELQLPDGSHVILGPATRLAYRASRNGERRVDLQGQAYFAVTADARRPFVVQTGAIATRVLGTSFTVRAYAGSQVQVGVAEGKVAVGDTTAATVLLAGDIGRVGDGRVVVTHNASIADVFGWTRGQFVLKDVPLREAADELERQYAMTLRIPDAALAARAVTVAFTGQSSADMLAAIALIADASYTRRDSVIVLTPLARGAGAR